MLLKSDVTLSGATKRLADVLASLAVRSDKLKKASDFAGDTAGTIKTCVEELDRTVDRLRYWEEKSAADEVDAVREALAGFQKDLEAQTDQDLGPWLNHYTAELAKFVAQLGKLEQMLGTLHPVDDTFQDSRATFNGFAVAVYLHRCNLFKSSNLAFRMLRAELRPLGAIRLMPHEPTEPLATRRRSSRFVDSHERERSVVQPRGDRSGGLADKKGQPLDSRGAGKNQREAVAYFFIPDAERHDPAKSVLESLMRLSVSLPSLCPTTGEEGHPIFGFTLCVAPAKARATLTNRATLGSSETPSEGQRAVMAATVCEEGEIFDLLSLMYRDPTLHNALVVHPAMVGRHSATGHPVVARKAITQWLSSSWRLSTSHRGERRGKGYSDIDSLFTTPSFGGLPGEPDAVDHSRRDSVIPGSHDKPESELAKRRAPSRRAVRPPLQCSFILDGWKGKIEADLIDYSVGGCRLRIKPQPRGALEELKRKLERSAASAIKIELPSDLDWPWGPPTRRAGLTPVELAKRGASLSTNKSWLDVGLVFVGPVSPGPVSQ